MDSNDQERERGITILAKAAVGAVEGRRPPQPRRHAGPRRLRRRGRAGPRHGRRRAAAGRRGRRAACPRLATCCRRRSPPTCRRCLVLNKVDRHDARTRRGAGRGGGAVPRPRTPRSSCSTSRSSRRSPATADRSPASGMPGADADLTPLLDTIIDHDPGAPGDPTAPLQALVTNLDASDYLGRLAVGRVVGARSAAATMWCSSTRRRPRAQAAAVRAAHPTARLRGLRAGRGRRARRRRSVRYRRVPRSRDR